MLRAIYIGFGIGIGHGITAMLFYGGMLFFAFCENSNFIKKHQKET